MIVQYWKYGQSFVFFGEEEGVRFAEKRDYFVWSSLLLNAHTHNEKRVNWKSGAFITLASVQRRLHRCCASGVIIHFSRICYYYWNKQFLLFFLPPLSLSLFVCLSLPSFCGYTWSLRFLHVTHHVKAHICVEERRKFFAGRMGGYQSCVKAPFLDEEKGWLLWGV